MARDWTTIRDELLAMAAHDLRVREELAADGSLYQGYNATMQAVHDANAARLASLLDTHGWPGEYQVGHQAAMAAWLIVQHAIAQPAFQRRALELLQEAVRQGSAPAVHAAMLEDRIRSLEGRPQLYGTQFDWDPDGCMSPLPIEDPAGVDARRRSIGLGPLAQEVVARRAAVSQTKEQPPRDWSERQREMAAWCREVGWRD
ncbi:MAG TPA: DUF6624 domain-containing protein [Gemmatimonadales bacterium]|jgi:hypothetical protein|nr:DUF6624 domain-containing protein [Gemmatimonadales bacterium]